MNKYKAINRVASFMNMAMAGHTLDSEAAKEELKDTDIMLNYMGNGASDMLTVKNINDFLKEVKELNDL